MQENILHGIMADEVLDIYIDSLPEPYDEKLFTTKKIIDPMNYDFKESLGLSFKVFTNHLYGLPERADGLLLKVTENEEPYRLYNIDIFKHPPYSP